MLIHFVVVVVVVLNRKTPLLTIQIFIKILNQFEKFFKNELFGPLFLIITKSCSEFHSIFIFTSILNFFNNKKMVRTFFHFGFKLFCFFGL